MSVLQSAWNGLVHTGFRLLYQEMSWSYDAVSHVVSLGQWQAWRQACIPYLAGPRVLELGCGPGHLQVELAARSFQPVGLDVSPQMTRMAAQRSQRAGLSPGIVQGLAEALPFGDGRFNTVVATFPTPYIAADATLSEVRRVLAPGGRLVIVPEAQLTGGGGVRRLIDIAYRLTGQRPEAASDNALRWSTILCDRLSAAGLTCAIDEVLLPDSRVTIVVGRL